MKLDYSILISPFPFYLAQIGSVKSPTLREIFSPEVTYEGYNLYLSLLLMTPQTYFEKVNPSKAEWYQSLSDEQKCNLTMFDLITADSNLQSSFSKIFNFFLTETVIWSHEDNAFLTFREKNQVGSIHKNAFQELCELILQRCSIQVSDLDTAPSKIKSKRALEIFHKLQKGRQHSIKNSKQDQSMELPNIITSVAVKSNSINFTNIWDLTVYQLMEQFKREQMNVYFDIQKMSVAAYGNEKHTFKGDEWFKTEK